MEGFEEESSWSVLNHQTYVLDLKEANQRGIAPWTLEYDARKAYNFAANLTSLAWGKLLQDWSSYLQHNITSENSSCCLVESLQWVV